MLEGLNIALRRLARRPGFTLPAVATLAVGVGATTAIFSAVNAVLLRPLPYAEPEHLFVLRTAQVSGSWSDGEVSNAELVAIASGAPSVITAEGATGTGMEVIVADDGRNQPVSIGTVTDGFFDLGGLPLALGRGSTAAPRNGGYGGMVLSYRIWDQMFARDPDIVGASLRFPSGAGTVVGVAPPDFDLPGGMDVWEVFAPSPTAEAKVYTGFLRVRPGTTADILRSELDAVMASRVDDGLDPGGRTFVVTPLVDSIVGDLGPILWITFAAAAILLALGCANVAALILARGRTQIRELAIRKALGANGAAVSRELFTESLILSALGTGLGLLLAYGGVHALSALGADGVPRLDRVPFDLNVLMIAVVTLVTTTVLIGLLPMQRLTGLDVRSLLGEGSRQVAGERGSRHILSGIVVAEIAMALVLVTSAGWLVRSYVNLTETDPGFLPESRLVFQPMLIGTSYLPIDSVVYVDDGSYLVDNRSGDSPETWVRDLRSRLEQLDAFRAVGVSSVMPFEQDPPSFQYVSIPGRVDDVNGPSLTRFQFVSPDFFDAMGIRLLAGRKFVSDDDRRTTAIVNDSFVRTYLEGQEPIGLTFATGFQPGVFRGQRTIVGVVADVRYRSLREPDSPAYYIPDYLGAPHVVVSTSLPDPTPLIPAVREAVDALIPGIPVTIKPLEQVMSTELARHRLGLMLMSLFGAVSLLLVGIGIQGVVGHSTSLRSTEFAVRIAVGASPTRIVGSVLKQGGRLWLLGISIGVGFAYVAGRFGPSQLYQVRASDPVILLVAISAVSALAAIAYSLSAVRGSRVNPGTVLKGE
jgi:putative ABC transport system permease protein